MCYSCGGAAVIKMEDRDSSDPEPAQVKVQTPSGVTEQRLRYKGVGVFALDFVSQVNDRLLCLVSEGW